MKSATRKPWRSQRPLLRVDRETYDLAYKIAARDGVRIRDVIRLALQALDSPGKFWSGELRHEEVKQAWRVRESHSKD